MTKIGIIGTGYWGKHHLRVFSKAACELVGVADVDPSKESLAQEYNVKFYTDYKKLLRKVDAVTIVTPPATHYKIAKKALKLGKHVLIEKPFVLKRSEAEDLITLAKEKKRILMIGHIYLYHPGILALKTIMKSGDLGKIYYIISQRLNLGIVRSDVNSLLNFAPHDLSILLFLLEEMPILVSCFGQYYLQRGIEDVTFLTLKYQDNIMVHLILSWLHPAKVRELTVVGSKKMAVFDDVHSTDQLRIYDKGVDVQRINQDKQWESFGEFKMKTRFGDVVTPSFDICEPLKVEAEHFLDCIVSGKTPRSDGQTGLNVLRIPEAASKSLKKGGKTVSIR